MNVDNDMTCSLKYRMALLLFAFILLPPPPLRPDPAPATARPSGKHLGELYDRIAAELEAGRPLVATVYVALCDNDSQGIVPVKNPKICRGDHPENNLYWAASGGLKGHARTQRWKNILYERRPNDVLAARGVWRKRLVAGGALRKRGVRGGVEVFVVGLAYRGTHIRDAMADYLTAVNRDTESVLALPSGRTIRYGGTSHLIGYIGHDYFMDEPNVPRLLRETGGKSRLAKGVFGLACMSETYFRPGIERSNTHILALNVNFTYPSAFTALGIVRAVSKGADHRGIHREAARAFARGQNKSVGTMRRALSYGDRAD